MSEQPSAVQDTARVLHLNSRMPTLEIPWPECGHCGHTVEIEDGVASCEFCLIQWDRIDEDTIATPDEAREGTNIPCGIAVGKADPPHSDKRGNYYVPGKPKPCILPSGHEGVHLCPYDVEVTRPTSPGEGSEAPDA